MTPTPNPPSAQVPAPAGEGSASHGLGPALWLSGAAAAVILLFVGVAEGCTAMSGGSVRSEAQFLEHVRDTQAAGEDVVRSLGAIPSSVVLDRSSSDASCKDDLGVDGDDTERDQPTVTWAPDFGDGDAGYRAAVVTLRKRWTEQGLKVTTRPQADPVTGKETGLQEIRTTDDGVTLSLSPGRRTGEGLVVADGGCVRHHGVWTDQDGK
ncbi:hypothetical protein ABZX93_26760 [Streptomyces sp. NPDC006632]|uniref:hypothetical protein n=1 Tax=Streptomyces sp. NPDC006632 TaxID=3157182 RepID=UPI00339F3CC4